MMPQIATADFKNGMTLDLDDGLFTLVEFQHVKPGKGGAFVRTTLKNVRTGSVVDRTFRAGEKMERAIVDKKEMQLLYRDGGDYVFMDNSSYEQLDVPAATLGELAGYLVDSATALLLMYGDEIIGVELPASVELTIAETEPGVQGDRVSGAKKPATLETGKVVQVPLFIEPGERVKVDTRTGEFISRA
jgi:elongation factor P